MKHGKKYKVTVKKWNGPNWDAFCKKPNLLQKMQLKVLLWLSRITPKNKRIEKIVEQLNAWTEAGRFEYREYKDSEGTQRYEFYNGYISFTYFPEYEVEHINGSGFWFGARYHLPLKLAKDIVNFFYSYCR